MSSLPGYDLEDFVAWNYDLVVEGQGDANVSLQLAELMGNIPKRPRLTKEQFATVLAPFEPYRKDIEGTLEGFDEDNCSWRDYAGAAFDFIPKEVYEAGAEALRAHQA